MAEDMWHDPILHQGKVLSSAGEAARERCHAKLPTPSPVPKNSSTHREASMIGKVSLDQSHGLRSQKAEDCPPSTPAESPECCTRRTKIKTQQRHH